MKGVNKYANFKQFLDKHPLVRGAVEGTDVFIGHTRKSTVGAHTEKNAHPFRVGDYIQAHNGVITNVRDLAKKHEVKKAFEVDSHGLARIIEKDGFGVLDEYEGKAALAMTNITEPGTLYIYKGGTKYMEHDPEQLYEEKPLFFLVQPEGIYFSSIEESLNAITENDNKAERLFCNGVYKIQNGVFTNDTFVLNREQLQIVKPKPPKKERETRKIEIVKSFSGKNTGTIPKDIYMDKNLSDIILLEPNPKQAKTANHIYYKNGRYWANESLLHGMVDVLPDGTVQEGFSNTMTQVFYFIRGIMMRDWNHWREALDKLGGISTRQNIALQFSKYSRYPIFNLTYEATDVLGQHYRNKWFWEEKIVCGRKTFAPDFSDFAYFVDNGITKMIVEKETNLTKDYPRIITNTSLLTH